MSAELNAVTRHHHLADEAVDMIKSAISTLDEMEPAVASAWDSLTDLKRELNQQLIRAIELRQAYGEARLKLEPRT